MLPKSLIKLKKSKKRVFNYATTHIKFLKLKNQDTKCF